MPLNLLGSFVVVLFCLVVVMYTLGAASRRHGKDRWRGNEVVEGKCGR